MSRDEAIKKLQGWRSAAVFDGYKEWKMKEANPALDEALGMAIEALNAQKSGVWKVYRDCEGKQTQYECPFCDMSSTFFAWQPKYCDNCGARLTIPEWEEAAADE